MIDTKRLLLSHMTIMIIVIAMFLTTTAATTSVEQLLLDRAVVDRDDDDEYDGHTEMDSGNQRDDDGDADDFSCWLVHPVSSPLPKLRAKLHRKLHRIERRKGSNVNVISWYVLGAAGLMP